jgi:hypothetical protein
VRRDEGVLDACVERRGAAAFVLCLREAPLPDDADWSSVRGATLDRLRTANGEHTLMLERKAREGSIDVRVTMTFEAP